MDLFFDAVNPDGQKGFVKCNDMLFDYYAYRDEYPEYFCIDLINAIKARTGKKAAIIFGNCQTGRLRHFLLNNSIFSREYFFIRTPDIWEFKPGRMCDLFQENFWGTCDLLISQRVSRNNKFGEALTTQNLPARLPEDTKIIWIPNAYFDGYFPQRVANLRNVDMHIWPTGQFPHGDKYVDAFMTGGGRSIAELTEFLREQKFISEGEVKACVEKSFDELQKREWPCDIHILDFIVDNYKRRQIFYAPNHPAPNVILEITQRILKFMGISDMSFNSYDFMLSDGFALHGQDVPVYPKVKKFFGWSENDCINEYNANTGVSGFRGDYITFLQEYVRRCWADKLRPE